MLCDSKNMFTGMKLLYLWPLSVKSPSRHHNPVIFYNAFIMGACNYCFLIVPSLSEQDTNRGRWVIWFCFLFDKKKYVLWSIHNACIDTLYFTFALSLLLLTFSQLFQNCVKINSLDFGGHKGRWPAAKRHKGSKWDQLQLRHTSHVMEHLLIQLSYTVTPLCLV